jgi:hypothetical protein
LNALVLRALMQPGAPEASYFEVRWEPVPNLTSHLLLAGLTRWVDPPVAEKALASLVIGGLVLTEALFLECFDALGPAAPLAFLLLFNRCFFLGFYNYLLSLAMALLLFRVFLRGERTRGRALGLALLLSLTWFTHLGGFAVAVVGLAAFAWCRQERWKNLRLVALASLPALLLSGWYLLGSRFLASGDAGRTLRRFARGVGLEDGLVVLMTSGLHRELFAVHAASFSVGLLGLGLAALALVLRGRAPEKAQEGAKGFRRGVYALSLVLLAGYLLVPDQLGPHGSLFKARLAPLPFLVALALLPSPRRPVLRFALGAAAGLLVLLNLGLVWRHFAREERSLVAFTSAAGLLPRGATLVAVKPRARADQLVDARAPEYYCLSAHALCLSDYEPATRHFPVRFKEGVKQRIQDNSPGSFWADAVLADGASAETLPAPEEPYREVYRSDGLRLFLRGTAAAPESPARRR